MSFNRGFGWGFGAKFGSFLATLLTIAIVVVICAFLVPRVASAIYWAMAVLAIVVGEGVLTFTALKSEGTLRRRKLVVAALIAIYVVMWMAHTYIERTPG